MPAAPSSELTHATGARKRDAEVHLAVIEYRSYVEQER